MAEDRQNRVTRRDLLRSGAIGSAAMLANAVGNCSRAEDVEPFELDEVTIDMLQEGMRTGRFTSHSLVELYLDRIKELDDRLLSVIEKNSDAPARANAMDAERKAKGARGPLHGIPILIKDNIATADHMETTAGSLALEGAKVPRDAHLVSRLRAAGAVIVGKTNLSEWANFRSTHSSSGWSGRGGQCRNPYALDRSPSGSSSGSGAATAANFAAAAVGTETDGSITSPSAANSLVGIKPTLGLISRAGIVPIAHSQDTAGPMARTVRDAALLLTVMAGRDSNDPATNSQPAWRDYTRFLNPDGLKGARIGVPRNKLFGYHPATDKLAEEALKVLKSHGAILIDPANVTTAGQFDDTELEVLLYEFKADLNAFLTSRFNATGPQVRSLKEVIAFNERNRPTEMPYFAQEIMLMAQKKGPLTEKKYLKALARNHELSRTKGIDAVMDKHRLDALVAPTQGPVWLIDLVNGDSSGGSCTTLPAVAGYPHITVPMGYVRGLPVGLSFFGRAWSEPTLIKLAYAFEQATKVRRSPTFAPSASLT